MTDFHAGPPAPNTVAGLLHPESTAPALLTEDCASMGHAALASEVERLATQLRSAGLGPEDRVAIVLPNGPEMALVLLAVMAVGCAAPLNPRYREEEFRFYLDDLGCAAMITVEGATPAAEAAAPEGVVQVRLRGRGLSIDLEAQGSKRPTPATPDEDSPGAHDPAPDGPGPGTSVRFSPELAQNRTEFPGPDDDAPGPDDIAMVLHTSGTTSRPKIVPLRQRHIGQSARNIAAHFGLTAADRSLEVMPLFHIHGLMASFLAPLCAGGSVVCTPGFDAFKFHRWVDELSPTFYTAVPTMHQMVLARAPEKRATTLRFVRSSSAALPAPVMSGLQDLFGVPVIEGYGMTEATHQITCNPLPPGAVKAGSVGIPTGVEVAVLGPRNEVLPPGERGEIAIRGATVIDGYENNPTANASSFTAGWFRTGDEGTLDGDGYLFLTGRLKEQINRGGEKISPLEIENVLLGHPAIAEAVAFAVPHDKLGEEAGAAVVPVDGQGPTPGELRSYLADRLAPFKVPRTIVIVKEIPKGATGKVQRIGMAAKLDLPG